MQDTKKWQSQEEQMTVRYYQDEVPEIFNIKALVWYSEYGQLMAIEPFAEYCDGTRRYFERVSGSDLDEVDIIGQGLMYEDQEPCSNALKYAADWLQ
ncbi:TPA: hypothetical protein ACGO1T_001871 [Streptococcus suis]